MLEPFFVDCLARIFNAIAALCVTLSDAFSIDRLFGDRRRPIKM